MVSICRNCIAGSSEDMARCPSCGSPRILRHDELSRLSISHLDCDAFYASVEKRDNPELADRPVIIGGGKRGVVATACYIARIRGVRSAMPMFQALRLCPDAVVVRPRMKQYVAVSRQIRKMMLELTPLVEPLSLDEAFLDLTGTRRLHGASPGELMVRLQNRIEKELLLSVSIGLSHNKFLAKIASDLDKPRGFSVIGERETEDFLAARPIGLIWGVGAQTADVLERQGIRTIGDLRRRERADLIRRFGTLGDRLWNLAQGNDHRRIRPEREAKSVSNETTFPEDVSDSRRLEWYLWSLCEQVSSRAKAGELQGKVVFLKLKRSDHRLISRRQTLSDPTSLAIRIFRTAREMLRREIGAAPFRLIGVGLGRLSESRICEHEADFFGSDSWRRDESERLVDSVRSRHGTASIMFGRSLRQE